jgi:iron complex transport system permease protein
MLAVTMNLGFGLLGVTSIPLASFAGSIVATAIVYALASSQRRGLSTNVLLLAGVTLNAFFSAMILFVQYIADFTEAIRAIRWMMGGLDVAGYTPIVAALPFTIIAFAAFAFMARTLNLLSVGAEAAASRGVEVIRAQRTAFLSASLATGAAVSLGGPIGFIGIIVPHLVRLLVGSDHRIVLPASAMFGASFLVLCDLVARTAMAPLEIPVGVVTALIGGPFFLWLLVKRS